MRIRLLILFFLTGCTDAGFASFEALGKSGHIICYSGGEKIYEGDSTGRIATVERCEFDSRSFTEVW